MISAVIIAVMWCYAWLTGMTPSVVRAVVMVTIFEVGRMAYRKAFSLNTIAAAAVLILIARPTDLWSVSFQLSFTATAAIVVFAQTCEKWIHHLDWSKSIFGKAVAWVAGTVIISIAAQLGTLPLTMFYFSQISTFFLLANLIVLPLATFLVPCGLISITLGGSAVGIAFSKITWALAWAMNHAVEWIESLPGSTIHVSVSSNMVILYYVLFCCFCLALSSLKQTNQ